MLTIGLAVAVAATPAMIPKGPWVLEAEQYHCAIRRDLRQSDTASITLSLKPGFNAANGMQLILPSSDGASGRSSGQAAITIGSTGKVINAPYTTGVIPDKSTRVTTISVDHDVLTELRDGDSISVSAAPVDVSFTLASVGKVRSALHDCRTALLKSWGVEELGALASPPSVAGNPGAYFDVDNYPAEAIRNHVQGRVILALSIDTLGAVRQCRIAVSESPLLNDGSCRAGMRLRFQAARHTNGAPVASTYILPVRWVLPAD